MQRDLIAAAESSLLATLGNQGEVAQAISDAVPEMPMDAEVAMGPAAGGLDSPDTAPAGMAAPSAHAGPGKVCVSVISLCWVDGWNELLRDLWLLL